MSDEIGYDRPEFVKTKYGGITTGGIIRESLFEEDLGVQELLMKKGGRSTYGILSEEEKVLKKMNILLLEHSDLFENELNDDNKKIMIKSIVNQIKNIQYKNTEALLFGIKFYFILSENFSYLNKSEKTKLDDIKKQVNNLFDISVKENVSSLDVIRYFHFLQKNKLIPNFDLKLIKDIKFNMIIEKPE